MDLPYEGCKSSLSLQLKAFARRATVIWWTTFIFRGNELGNVLSTRKQLFCDGADSARACDQSLMP